MNSKCSALAVVVALLAVPAMAQAPLPPSMRIAGVTEAEMAVIDQRIREYASAAGISERALRGIAERLGVNTVENGRPPAERILEALESQAQTLASMSEQLRLLQDVEAPESAALVAEARRALDAGEIDEANRLLQEIATIEEAAGRSAAARADLRFLRAAAAVQQQAALADAQGDYLAAVRLYLRAHELIPEDHEQERRGNRALLTFLMGGYAHASGDLLTLRMAAIALADIGDQLDPVRDRDLWLSVYQNLSVYENQLAERGQEGALERSIAASHAALRALSRQDEPGPWARVHINLAVSYQTLAGRGDVDAARRSLRALEQAAMVLTRERNPTDWAIVQGGLGNTHFLLYRLNGSSTLDQAHVAFANVLSVVSDADFELWANAHLGLGNVHYHRAIADGSATELAASLSEYQTVLAQRSEMLGPRSWAYAKQGEGMARFEMARRINDLAEIERSIEAFGSAQRVFRRETDPLQWARIELLIAFALEVKAYSSPPAELEQWLEASARRLRGIVGTPPADLPEADVLAGRDALARVELRRSAIH